MSTIMESWPRRHRITVDEYYRMAEVGLLARDARVELIEGEIIDMAPIGIAHGSVVDRLARLLMRAVGDQAIVRVQGVVSLSRSSEPQPDLTLLKPRNDFYASRHPTASDTLLIIEVSDTTLRYDREIKVPLYARHGVPEVWIVDLGNGQLHFYRSLAGGQYGGATATDKPGMTTIAALSAVSIDLTELLKI